MCYIVGSVLFCQGACRRAKTHQLYTVLQTRKLFHTHSSVIPYVVIDICSKTQI